MSRQIPSVWWPRATEKSSQGSSIASRKRGSEESNLRKWCCPNFKWLWANNVIRVPAVLYGPNATGSKLFLFYFSHPKGFKPSKRFHLLTFPFILPSCSEWSLSEGGMMEVHHGGDQLLTPPPLQQKHKWTQQSLRPCLTSATFGWRFLTCCCCRWWFFQGSRQTKIRDHSAKTCSNNLRRINRPPPTIV